jgi:hypothetical protein
MLVCVGGRSRGKKKYEEGRLFFIFLLFYYFFGWVPTQGLKYWRHPSGAYGRRHQLMAAGMVHVTAGMVHVTNLTPGRIWISGRLRGGSVEQTMREEGSRE